MTNDVNPDLDPIEPDTDNEPIRTDPDVTGGDEGDDKGPVPYDRFKEVNDPLQEYKRLGLSPHQIIERLSRLGVLEQIMASDGDEPKREPKTDDEKAEAYQKDQAKKLILELFPSLNKAEDEQSFAESFKQANATEAWFTTIEVMEDAGMDAENPQKVKAIASICKEIIEGDPRLLSKYNSGKANLAVEGAFKQLRKQFGGKDSSPDDPRPAKLRDKKKLSKLTRTPKAGGVPQRTKDDEDKGPADLDAADKNVMARLKSMDA